MRGGCFAFGRLKSIKRHAEKAHFKLRSPVSMRFFKTGYFSIAACNLRFAPNLLMKQ